MDRRLTYEQALESQIEYVENYPIDFDVPGLQEDVLVGVKMGMRMGLEIALETYKECHGD